MESCPEKGNVSAILNIDVVALSVSVAIQRLTCQLLTLDLDHNSCMTSKPV